MLSIMSEGMIIDFIQSSNALSPVIGHQPPHLEQVRRYSLPCQALEQIELESDVLCLLALS